MWKKLLSCCLCLMLVLGSFAPLAGAEGGITTPTDLCQHAGTTVQKINRVETDEVSCSDGVYHWMKGNIYDQVWCDNCGTMLSEKIRAVSQNRYEHEFADGKCTVCGQSYCAHENAVWEELSWNLDGLNVEVVDKTYHKIIKGTVRFEKTCPDCGGVVDVKDEERTNVLEKHELEEDNVCYICAYLASCEHANTHEEDDCWYLDIDAVEPPVVTPVDEKNHKVEGYHEWKIICDECDLFIAYGGLENTSALYPHTIVDGVCTECGYKCQHTATTTKQREEETNVVHQFNGLQHSFDVNVYEQVWCDDCGELVSETQYQSLNYYDHEFVNGVCSVCGQRYCDHQYATWDSDWDIDRSEFEQVDDTYHKVIKGIEWSDLFCPDCSSLLDYRETERENVIVKHSLNDKGVCNYCGYVSTCSHPNTHKGEVENWFKDPECSGAAVYTAVDENTHKVEGFHYWELICDECELRVGWDEKDFDTAIYPHHFVNGVCILCDYKQPAQAAMSSAVMRSSPSRPMRVTRSPGAASGTSVTSAII